ncbi:hypothetical protein NC652_019889 [Populus alba x Populus x berolinensis]|nr:hypothetical protein NC652_019889 [Populus alba x Populus x berolinensis]
MLGNRAVRAANANSVPTNLRRSTRKRRLSAHLEDYTDSSGSEDEDLMVRIYTLASPKDLHFDH